MISVFTPTYNRKDTLSRLYKSLLDQSYKDFEWLIVDDGSQDNTEDLILNFIAEAKITIRYFKQENGGKHRAINKGLDLAEGELFFIVDSDDYLLENSLSRIDHYYQDIRNNETIIGVVGFRCYPDGKIIGGSFFLQHITDSNLIEERSNVEKLGDMAQVIKTKLFKEYKFPDIPGEKFVAESIVWNRMAIKYKMRYFNEAIYVGEYLEGGLSDNSIRNRRKYPKYATLLYLELAINPKADPKTRFVSLINFWRFGFCRDESLYELLNLIDSKFLAIFALPFGFLFYVRDSLKN